MPNNKYYVFTYWKFPENILDYLCKISQLSDFKYVVAQLEKSHTGSLYHIQGYVEFYKNVSYKCLKSVMPGVHVEHRKGTRLEARYYCMKNKGGIYDDDYYWCPPRLDKVHRGRDDNTLYYELGIWETEQGKRNDLNAIRQLIIDGIDLSDIITEHATNYQAMRMAEKIFQYKNEPRDINNPPEVRWYYGDTGTGKTKAVYDEFSAPEIYSSFSYKWWDGYYNHRVILIDDMRKDYCKFHVLLTLLDRYPLIVEKKGMTTHINSPIIIITCPYSPQVLYNTREDTEQLLRRIHEVRHYHDDGYCLKFFSLKN